jgi:hypothetical protein
MSTKTLMILSAIIVAVMGVVGVWAWSAAPEISRIAVHWNFAGEAVAYRAKETVLAAPPLLTLAFSILMSIVTSSATGGNGAKRNRAIWIGGLLALSLVYVFFVLASAGIVTEFGNYTALAPATFLGVIGNYLAKGSTQRWPGRLMVLTCLATFATWILIPGAAAELVFVAGAVASAVAIAASRNDADGASADNGA